MDALDMSCLTEGSVFYRSYVREEGTRGVEVVFHQLEREGVLAPLHYGCRARV